MIVNLIVGFFVGLCSGASVVISQFYGAKDQMCIRDSNMQSAIDLGNRILMMDSGNIVLDIGGEEKKDMTVDGLLEKFKTGVGKALDNDRILLSE